MAGRGGARPGAGAKKGSKRAVTLSLKENMERIHQDLEKRKKGITVLANEDPKWFYVNFIKPMLPKDVVLGGDLDLNIIIKDIE